MENTFKVDDVSGYPYFRNPPYLEKLLLYGLSHVGKAKKINLGMVSTWYPLFIVIWGMIYYCFTHMFIARMACASFWTYSEVFLNIWNHLKPRFHWSIHHQLVLVRTYQRCPKMSMPMPMLRDIWDSPWMVAKNPAPPYGRNPTDKGISSENQTWQWKIRYEWSIFQRAMFDSRRVQHLSTDAGFLPCPFTLILAWKRAVSKGARCPCFIRWEPSCHSSYPLVNYHNFGKSTFWNMLNRYMKYTWRFYRFK